MAATAVVGRDDLANVGLIFKAVCKSCWSSVLKRLFSVIAPILLILSTACSHQKAVGAFDGAALSRVGDPERGKFVATIELANKPLILKTEGFSCAGMDYRVDIDEGWKSTLQSAVRASLDKVEFQEKLFTVNDLIKNNYDAQVGFSPLTSAVKMKIYPGNGTLLGYQPASVTTTVTVSTTMRVNWPNEKVVSKEFSTVKESSQRIFMCKGPEESAATSTEMAIKELIKDAMIHLKVVLAQNKRG